MTWRILPDCRTPSFLEIWLPRSAPANAVEIEVIPSAGEASIPIAGGQAYICQPGGDVLCAVVYLERVANGDRNMIMIAVAPTLSTSQPGRDLAPSGTWSIRIRNISARSLDIDARIQRNDSVFGGLPYGRQSRFEDPDYELYDHGGREIVEDNERSYVRREGTINAIATGERTVVLGAFRRSDGVAAPYSSAGWQKVGRRPDAMAVGDDMASKRGVRAAGSRSRSSVAMNGTSVAAPQVTRWIASEMAAGRPGDQAAVRAEARRQEADRKSQPGGSPYPTDPTAEVGGDGRIDIPPVITVGR